MINTHVNSQSAYYHHLRLTLLGLAKSIPQRVLEVGAAAGQSLTYFKEKGSKFVAGIELVPEVAEIARAKPEIDEIIVGDIQEVELPFEPASFDLLIAGHVLEHVRDPWKIQTKMLRYLRPGGQFIGSLPNVRCIYVTLPLVLKGRWDYTEEGILDWTHYRFFTKHSIRVLLEGGGLRVEHLKGEISDPKFHFANAMTLGLFEEFFAFTYNWSAFKA